MSDQNFGYYEEVFFPEEDNEWVSSSNFGEARILWEKSKNIPGDKNYRKACDLLAPYFDISFDKERMIDNFAEMVTEPDEDGWTSIGSEERLFGLRKSVFKKYDEDSYEREEVDSCAVLAIDFTERDDDGLPIKDSFLNTPHITLIATKNTDVKKEFKTQEELEKWESKNNYELSYCFSLEISDELTTYIDEDGDETSGYSSEGGWEGVVVYENKDTVETFSSRLQSFAHGVSGEEESVEIGEEIQEIFDAIYTGDIEKLKELIPNDFDINQALAGPQITMPLAIAFASIFFSKKGFKDIYGQVFDLKGRSFQKEGSIEEVIYFLVSKGGDLSYQIMPGVSYLSMALSFSEELTNFLLSFGIDVSSEAADAILIASSEGKLNYVEQFLELGADPNFSITGGTTAIMYAAQGEKEGATLSLKRQKVQIQIIEKLLAKGADVDAIDDGGDSALSNAVRCKNKDIIKFLLENKANPNIGSKKGSISPYKLAIESKSDEIQKILEDYGAKKVESRSPKQKPKQAKKPNRKVPIGSKKQKVTSQPKGKIQCPSCSKYFAQSTIDKWGGICGTCHRKKYPDNPRHRKVAPPDSNSGCMGSFLLFVTISISVIVGLFNLVIDL